MSLLSIQGVGLSIGARDIFAGVGATLPADGKVGLVGPNGVGKTSLLRIIAGLTPPTTGRVHVAEGARLGLLRQEAVEAFAGREHSVYDEMLTAFASLQEIAARLEEMEARMAAGEASDALLGDYGALQERFERAGGYDYEVRVRQVLDGLGFPRDLWATPVGHLSGGQKTRALLARLLLEEPTLLILDEPTNHLDLQAIEWLETTLRGWSGALLVASHDRYFLDRVVNRIWEMSPRGIESYRGTYSAYVQQRQERQERTRQLYETEKERLERELELVKRYIGWRKFDEAKGKLKRLSRDLVAIERYGLMGSLEAEGVDSVHIMSVAEAHQRVKEMRPPADVTPPPVLRVRLKRAARGGTIVLRATGLQVGYDGTPLISAGDLELERLERVALIGPNGAGKTTFLRTVLGDLAPLAGGVRLGAGLKIGYVAQAHDNLRGENAVLDELLSHGDLSPGEARDYLAQYLFRGEDVYKPVRALSGGERARLALAILALEGVNLLLLDEPTNHLDIPAQEVLQDCLEGFEGTLLMVSHDRYLIDRLATAVWELRDGRLHAFKGSYAEFLAARERAGAGGREAPDRPPANRPPADRPPANRRSGSRRSAAGQALDPGAAAEREARRRAAALADLEARIAVAEAALAEYGDRLQEQSAAGDIVQVAELGRLYAATQAQLEALLTEWTDLADA